MKLRALSALFLTTTILSSACAAPITDGVIEIDLSDTEITVNGKPVAASLDAAQQTSSGVYTGAEIIYYHDDTDETYGEGKETEKHAAEDAEAHTVVTITQAGTYRLSGSLSKGQIAIDLGKDAQDDPNAVVTLILDNVNVTCTVAPSLIFYNVYECDRAFIAYDNDENPDYTAASTVDTSSAGANIVIAAETENTFTGSHVARIYKEGTTKKLHKYDGAFYSKMSMNVSGENGQDSGVLNIVGDNEGLDSELHLTINGGTINVTSQDDGINTNEDFVSVTTVNGGNVHITGGLGSEGDGIDSNGYLVINGGSVFTTANPQTGDGGIDADSPILLNGGTVSAFGGRNDAADQTSAQPYMELSFASSLAAGSVLKLTDVNGNPVWRTELQRACQSVTLTTPDLALDTTYHLYVDDVLQCWNGNSFGMGHRGGGMRPDDFQRPDGQTLENGAERQEPPEGWEPGQRPDGLNRGDRPEMPENFDPSQFRDDFPRPDGMGNTQADGSGSTDFMLTADVKSFSGVCDSDASGKTRIRFTVDGTERSGRTMTIPAITAITPSQEIDAALVQVTVTDDPSENYATSCLLSDGLEAVNALLPQEDGDYILTIAVTSGNETYTGATQISFSTDNLPFLDISKDGQTYEAVKALWKAGAMEGTGEGQFSPDMTVTRAQAVTVLGRLVGAEQAEDESFNDVESDSWYSGYVGWAIQNRLVEGDGEGRFLPDSAVTAEQLTLMLGRLDEHYTHDTDFTGELTRAQLAQMLAAFDEIQR